MIERAKGVVRSLLPAAIASRLGLLHVWHGVYDSFAKVPRKGGGYEQETSTSDTVEMTRDLIELIRRSPDECDASPRDGGLLALLAANLAQTATPVRVVDFGGGAGVDLVHLRWLTRSQPFPVEYWVVELPSTCTSAKALYSDPAIHFVSTLDEVTSKPDIVHASASIAYIEDWRTTLGSLLGLQAEYLLLSNTLSGRAPTFATAQKNLRGTVTPYWFFARDELIELAARAGYDLMLEARTGPDYDQSNFERALRPGRARNMVFRRRPPAR